MKDEDVKGLLGNIACRKSFLDKRFSQTLFTSSFFMVKSFAGAPYFLNISYTVPCDSETM